MGIEPVYHRSKALFAVLTPASVFSRSKSKPRLAHSKNVQGTRKTGFKLSRQNRRNVKCHKNIFIRAVISQ